MRIALIAHDDKKDAFVDWAVRHRAALSRFDLVATGTTGGRVMAACPDLQVTRLKSGPLGGDQQIGARIAEQRVDMLVFFWDPFEPQPHDPDIKALLRVAAVWNIPVACNESSADYMLSSSLLEQQHEYRIPDYQAYLAARG